MSRPILDPRELVDLGADPDPSGIPRAPLSFVRVGGTVDAATVAAAAVAAGPARRLLVGLAATAPAPGPEWAPLLAALDLTLTAAAPTAATQVQVPDVDAAAHALHASVAANPQAALVLRDVLRVTAAASVPAGLAVESAAYSMLLGGEEFARWRVARPRRTVPPPVRPAVALERSGAELVVTIDRPERHNAFSVPVRDGLVEAFELVLADPTIERVHLAGAGPSFCSGGDLDEFGTTAGVPAHLIRLDRSVAARLDRCRDRVEVLLHGACIGAGIEIASFASRIRARDDAFFQLPELAMGLIPGAGGTVGVTRRIGRWRTAYLALTGERIAVPQALGWGLVDERA